MKIVYKCSKCGYEVALEEGEKGPEWCPKCIVTHIFCPMEPTAKPAN